MGNNINYGTNYGNIGDTSNTNINNGFINNGNYSSCSNYGTIYNGCTFNWQQLDQEMAMLDRCMAQMPPVMIQNYGELRLSVQTRDQNRLSRVLKTIGGCALDFIKQLGLQILPSLLLAAL